MRMDRSSERCDEWTVRANGVECECDARERANVSHNMFEKKRHARDVRPVSARVAEGVSGHWVRECVEYGTNERCEARLVIPT